MPANFDRLARPYHWLEYLTFGPILQNCRTQFLPFIPAPQNALILGDGDGRFTATLQNLHPNTQIDAVDLSSAMLHQLRHRSPHPSRIHTHHLNALDFRPTHTYDLIATHFFLDCLTTQQISQLLHNLAPSIRPNTTWLVSEFQATNTINHLIISALYKAFRLLTNLQPQQLPNHHQSLQTAGFQLHTKTTKLGGLLTSEQWQNIQRKT